jgi:hypothetical protein
MDTKKVVIIRHHSGTTLVCINKTKSEALEEFIKMYNYRPNEGFITETATDTDMFTIVPY